MDAPTFEWRNDLAGEGECCLVATVGDKHVAFRMDAGREDRHLRYVEMAAWSLWTDKHPEKLEGQKKLKSTFEKLQGHAIPNSVMVEIKRLDDLEIERLEYTEEAQEAYREFAGLTT